MQDTFHAEAAPISRPPRPCAIICRAADVYRLLPLNRSDLQQRSSHRDAGVRDHHVQAAEMPHVLGGRRLHAVGIGHRPGPGRAHASPAPTRCQADVFGNAIPTAEVEPRIPKANGEA